MRIANIDFKIISLWDGLIPPNDQAVHLNGCGCGCHGKVYEPSQIELTLASRKHRWAEMRKVQVTFMKSVGDLVIRMEKDLLTAFGLPDIDRVRRSLVDKDEINEFEGKAFEWNVTKQQAHRRIIGEFQKNLIGTDKLGKTTGEELTELPDYQYSMMTAYSASLKRVIAYIQRNAPAGVTREEILRYLVSPSYDNPYLKAVIDAGGSRIKTEIAIRHMKRLREVLMQMASEGKNPLSVARYLHRAIGEGDLWYWLRIVRSESVLAQNAAFQAQSRAAGVKYQRWSASQDACEICQTFHAQTWPLGSGPEPVSDSHPHCVLSTCRIYTLQGLRQIKNIRVGDMVLTHTGKYRPVTQIHRHVGIDQKMVRLVSRNDAVLEERSWLELRLTDNHPILIDNEWKPAGLVQKDDMVKVLADLRDDSKFVYSGLWDIKHYNVKRITLYNLSVADDESYVAEGFVVHNCQCVLIPFFEADRVQSPWERESPYDRPYAPGELQDYLNIFGRV